MEKEDEGKDSEPSNNKQTMSHKVANLRRFSKSTGWKMIARLFSAGLHYQHQVFMTSNVRLYMTLL